MKLHVTDFHVQYILVSYSGGLRFEHRSKRCLFWL